MNGFLKLDKKSISGVAFIKMDEIIMRRKMQQCDRKNELSTVHNPAKQYSCFLTVLFFHAVRNLLDLVKRAGQALTKRQKMDIICNTVKWFLCFRTYRFEGGEFMEQRKRERLLFELSYLNTSALFALREHAAPVLFSKKMEQAWETALIKASRRLRK